MNGTAGDGDGDEDEGEGEEGGFLSVGDCEEQKDDPVPGPSGINPAACPVGQPSKHKKKVKHSPNENSKDENDEDTEDEDTSFKVQQRLLSRFLKVTPDEIFLMKYAVFPDDKIVHGHNSRIYKGMYKYNGREVVLKCVRLDRRRKKMFTRHSEPFVFTEIMNMTQVQRFSTPCPYLIQMLDWYVCPDGYIVVLEKLSESWVTFDQFINESASPLSERTCRDLIHQLVRAIAYITECGLEHCDLLPKHVVINKETLELKVIGFGHCQKNSQRSHTVPVVNPIGPDGERYWYEVRASWDFLLDLRLLMTEAFRLNHQDSRQNHQLSNEFWQFYDVCWALSVISMRSLLGLPWMTQDEWTYSDPSE